MATPLKLNGNTKNQRLILIFQPTAGRQISHFGLINSEKESIRIAMLQQTLMLSSTTSLPSN
jgi:hypothetical protein